MVEFQAIIFYFFPFPSCKFWHTISTFSACLLFAISKLRRIFQFAIVGKFDMNCCGMPTKKSSSSSDSSSSRDIHSDILGYCLQRKAASVQKKLKIDARREYFINKKRESNDSHQIDFIFILPARLLNAEKKNKSE